MSQEAAGYFKLLHDVAAPQLDEIPSFDISPSCTEMLELLMLAQAQESFYLKANRDKKNPAVLARCGLMHTPVAPAMCLTKQGDLYRNMHALQTPGRVL